MLEKQKGKPLHLYMPAGYDERIERLLKRKLATGIDLTDNRGNPSISKLVRLLIDQELAKPEEEAA